jgi:thiamine transporter
LRYPAKIISKKGKVTMKRKITTRQLAESGILLALGYLLSMLALWRMPQGGSITAVSMLPLVFLGYKYGPGWGALCGLIHGLLQIVEEGLYAPPTNTLLYWLLMVLLDYALAWLAVGLIAGLVRKISANPAASIAVGSILGIAGRLGCSFLSGWLIWAAYAPEGQPPALYSITYNGSYLGVEMIITAVVGAALASIPIIQKNLRAAA